ncbi:MAG: efflux transporter outer membrane subunit [Gammaproteobacteria bacterium]|nr:efflux transporter outer membrane subunit [Gammaproteobacteria bacterium]
MAEWLRRHKWVMLPVISLALTACTTVGPDFVDLEPDAAAKWSQEIEQGLQTTPNELVEWWRVFNDPILNELVELARKNNNSIAIAGLRVLEAQAQLGIATGLQYPQSQVATGAAIRNSPAENTGTADFWQYGLGASVSWEIDFWGRFRRGIESADATYLASLAAYDQALVLLTAAVVDSYAVIRTTEEQLRIAHENLKIQKRSYDIAAVLYRNGAASELDMQQAETLLLATQSTVPDLEATLSQARNALSILLAQKPGQVEAMIKGGEGIALLPDDITVGFPADMLRRRPDVRQAELLAMAQNARIGLAKADLYPSFSLTGSIGLASSGSDADFGDLFNSDALTISVGPSFVWPFLNYGRIKNNVRVQDARLQQSLVNYRETVLQAARETEDAMAAYSGTRKQAVILEKTVISAKRSNDLSTLRYKEGFADYQRVLDAQQALFTQQTRYVSTLGGEFRSLVALYKALGGGWERHEGLPYIDAETARQMQERTDWGDLIEQPEDSSNSNREEENVQADIWTE